MAEDPAGALVERMDAIEAQNRELREQVSRLQAALESEPAPQRAGVPSGREPAPIGRRQLLRTAGAAAAGAVAGAVVLSDAQPAAATDNLALLAGQVNTATVSTELVTSNPSAQQGGLKIADTIYQGGTGFYPGLIVHATGGGFGRGIELQSATKSGVHVQMDSSATDVVGLDITHVNGIGARVTGGGGYTSQFWSTSGTALYAQSNTGNGASIFGQNYQLQLSSTSGRAAPTTDATQHYSGEFVRDTSNTLWFSIGSGTPGTWVRLAAPGTAGSLSILPTPVRVYDSRPGTQPVVGSKTPLAANTIRVLDLKANSSGVPADATGALLTVLLVNAASGNGNFTVWANGQAKPLSNTLVWGGSTGRFSATAVTAVDGAAQVQVGASLTTDLVLDVVGYYR